MLSNRILVVPQQNRALGEGDVEVLYRCGSQAGKVASHLPANAAEDDLAEATTAFLVATVREFRGLRSSKGKNPTRNLKKYLDRTDIQLIEENLATLTDGEIAAKLM